LNKNLQGRLEGFDRLQAIIAKKGIEEEVSVETCKRIVSARLRNAMEQQNISKTELSRKMKTSRPQLERILDGTSENISLLTIVKAAKALGKTVHIDIV
jgi:antitoxin HicB